MSGLFDLRQTHSYTILEVRIPDVILRLGEESRSFVLLKMTFPKGFCHFHNPKYSPAIRK